MTLTVLAIDDTAVIRDLVAVTLSADGIAVLQAEDGVRGLEALDAGAAPDVIVTDLRMPHLDGLGFIRAVRAGDPRCASLPILVLTTDSDDATRAAALRAGASGWVAKPFDPHLLVSAVRSLAS